MSDKKDISLLIGQAKKGEQKAFNDLLNLYWKDVYHFQFNKCQNEELKRMILLLKKSFLRKLNV